MMRRWSSAFLFAGAGLAAAGLSGCGTGVSSSSASAPAMVTAAPVQGLVMGGQQPVAGVTVQLYQAGTTGYGSQAMKLGPTVPTASNGNFSLPSYTCTANTQVYLVGTSGMPTTTLTNANLALMVGLGTCGGPDLKTFINVNELTTVATVWALAPFMTGIANIGSDTSNATGLANAFAVINELVATSSGTMPGPSLPAGATLPTNEINTLADILEQCINSGGGKAGDGSGCGMLFQYAPNAAGTVYPTDTITAMMNIAQNPGRNVSQLNKLRSGSPVFSPAFDVNTAPNAWTIAITYTGGGLNAPSSVATDANGSVWVTNKGNNSVTKLDYSGAAVSGASGFTAGGFSSPAAIAIDTGGNAWVANSGSGSNSITRLNSMGNTGTVYSGNGLSTPESIAIDGLGDVWVGNAGANTVSAFNNNGSPLSAYSGGGTSAPVSVAVTPK